MSGLGTTRTVTIKTPEGNDLIPFDEFKRLVVNKNIDSGISECRYQRRSGRTTRMVIEALETVMEDGARHILIEAHSLNFRKVIASLIDHYICQYNIYDRVWQQIHLCTTNEVEPGRGINIYKKFVDNAVTDRQEVEEMAQIATHKKGTSVDVILKDVMIKDIQFADHDRTIYQYVGITRAGVKVYFPEQWIVKSNQQ